MDIFNDANLAYSKFMDQGDASDAKSSLELGRQNLLAYQRNLFNNLTPSEINPAATAFGAGQTGTDLTETNRLLGEISSKLDGL